MYPSGWPDVVQIDDMRFFYTKSKEKILTGLNGATTAESTAAWLTVIAYAMEEESQELLIQAVDERKISGLALMVLANRLSEQALGLDLTAAGKLAGSLLGSWFLVAALCAKKGLLINGMEVHELLAATYSVQLDQCQENADLAKLNRKIFGTSHPWGR